MKNKRRVAMVLAVSMLWIQGQVNTGCITAKGMQTVTIYRGKTVALTITQKGKKKKTGNLYRYQTYKKSVISVSKTGKVKAKKAGTTTITLQKKSNKEKRKLKIVVVDYVKELRLQSATNLVMNEGTKKSIRAVVYPKTAKNRQVSYKSSNSKIVTVSADGTVRAIESGFATITVTTKGINKKGKKIAKKINVGVLGETSPIPTPYIPGKEDDVISTHTPVPLPTGTGKPTQSPSTGGGDQEETKNSLQEMIDQIPKPASSTLVAATIVAQGSKGTSTLYFINRNYQGNMHVSVDGMDMSSSSSAVYVLKRMATEVTGKGTSVSVNPGDKQENKYYDEKWGIWRDALWVSRGTLADAWLITNRKNGNKYRLSTWETDTVYGTPYGLIITEGDTTSDIVVY